jgi:hypothetical protein
MVRANEKHVNYGERSAHIVAAHAYFRNMIQQRNLCTGSTPPAIKGLTS